MVTNDDEPTPSAVTQPVAAGSNGHSSLSTSPIMSESEVQAQAQAQVEAEAPASSSAGKPRPQQQLTLQPMFHPPLWLARRTACIRALKKEGVRSVVDIGCGAGAVLQMLISPAYHLDSFPDLYAPDPVSHSLSSESRFSSPREAKLEQLRKVPRLNPEEEELHLRRVIGVDVLRSSLQQAARVTDPDGEGASSHASRWEECRVELYEGGLESYNQVFEGVEAMIATEVIEHLPPHLFDKFSKTILGLYQPRLVVVTTPNHEFNPYFIATSKSDEDSNRFPDPTGRTNRVFRDDDHQFEFTIDEFESWAHEVASENDYQVTFTGVGSLSHYYASHAPPYAGIPFPPPSLDAHPACRELASSKSLPLDPSTFYATQIAIFTRVFPNEVERSPRSHKPQPLPFFSSTIESVVETAPAAVVPSGVASPSSTATRPGLNARRPTLSTPHMHLQTHTHPPHPSASKPLRSEKLIDSLKKRFNEHQSSRLTLAQIWSNDQMRIDCGGIVGSLIDALLEKDDEGEWVLEAVVEGDEERGMDALMIEWKAFEPRKEEGDSVWDRAYIEEQEDDEERLGDGHENGRDENDDLEDSDDEEPEFEWEQ
ncbi:BQ2448_7791 [Microbotryum intermedium]|uniref:Small RNA 2'-O-methyltransferase n=1 Tax=Microbotryum intermedium TaxID=269621 RepID=A0A238FLX5_9BASI|nr:BQ2448_7791 [Microbotryum intermedium]